jgi:hypothetical protein
LREIDAKNKCWRGDIHHNGAKHVAFDKRLQTRELEGEC